MEETKAKIREFIQEAAQNKGLEVANDEESLTDIGVIDSLVIFRLVSFLEDNFGIRIADEQIVNENFRSINAIEGFVNDRLGEKGIPAR